MVLTVPFESFASTSSLLGLPAVAWLARVGARVRITAADPSRALLLRSETGMGVEACRARLTGMGFDCRDGRWSSEAEAEAQPGTAFWVAAVSYKSREPRPGLWVDILPYKPAAGEVLASLYEEFRASGDVHDMDMDEFIKAIEPNVVILDPEEQEQFALRRSGC